MRLGGIGCRKAGIYVHDVKERYGFASWPQKSAVKDEGRPVNCRIGEKEGVRLLKRYSMPYPASYEDVYESVQDKGIRISIKVINCVSFEKAKEQLVQRLAQCAAIKLPQITDRLKATAADIAFGAADMSGKSLLAVQGSAYVEITNIGSGTTDLIPFYEAFHGRHVRTGG